jgi:hypothetical protein
MRTDDDGPGDLDRIGGCTPWPEDEEPILRRQRTARRARARQRCEER